MRTITEIIIHCSATPNGRPVSAAEIDAWHERRGFVRTAMAVGYTQPGLRHIGYHYVICTHGAIDAGRAEEEIGAHCLGHNAQSIGVCMIGMDAFSLVQWASLGALVRGIRARTPSITAVIGHRETSPDIDGDGFIEPQEWLKTCPGFSVADWMRRNMTPLPLHVLDQHPIHDQQTPPKKGALVV